MAGNTVFDPQKLQSGNLADCEEQQILELAKKLCRIAAEECGENGYRGGIRPGNIYVAEDGRVAVGKTGKAGENGWTKLELEYMAPEMFWNGEESAAADVYSIALIMYAGLNGGRLPFAQTGEQSAEKRAHALRRRMSGDSFPMPEGVSEKLLEILKCALAFEPERRYEDPYAMLKALWEYCGDEPEEIKRIPAASPVPEPKPEKKPEPKPAPKPKQEKPAPKQETPKPQAKAADKAPAPVKPARTIHERRAEKRSAIALAAILLLSASDWRAAASASMPLHPSCRPGSQCQSTQLRRARSRQKGLSRAKLPSMCSTCSIPRMFHGRRLRTAAVSSAGILRR